ncbi:hypothetical protein HHK36_029149 [Tetracentron sinense]|uniref:CS domain-containing protein n=1 Tax=Tetracentron sinense TaxID=13715 RepID=A0A835D1B7_TETSI|nr:hypothetical protein HHK36_029149 [Tetracentron sinense]
MAEERGLEDAGKVEKCLKEAETPVSVLSKEVDEESSKKVTIWSSEGESDEEKTNVKKNLPASKKVTISSSEGELDEEKTNVKENLRDPNEGNGLDLDNYSWTQSLIQIILEVPVHDDTQYDLVDCDLMKNHLKVGLKGKPPLIDGELFQSVKVDSCFWTLEEATTIYILLTKHNRMEWWKCLFKGDPEIDIQKVIPENGENSELSDLELEIEETVENMMVSASSGKNISIQGMNNEPLVNLNCHEDVPTDSLGDPNEGNGLDLDNYSWTQSLKQIILEVPVHDDTQYDLVDCDLTKNHLKVGLKGKPPLIDGELFQSVKVDSCFWTLEEATTIYILLTKHNRMEWWKCLFKGDPEIDIQKVIPENGENSELSDLELEIEETVENMMCNDQRKRFDLWKTPEPGSDEFISALAAGMSAQLILEVSSGVSPSTIALAAAARQTGGRLVCILPEPTLMESKKVIKDSGLKDLVEFKVGDPFELLPCYENIDFSLIDCKTDDHTRLLKLLDVNPRKSVVVANNLVGGRNGLGGYVRGMDDKVAVRSMKHPIGKGMEVTMIGKSKEFEKNNLELGSTSKEERRGFGVRRTGKSKWVVKVDEETGEEHIFRVPRSL